eukprot:477370_1
MCSWWRFIYWSSIYWWRFIYWSSIYWWTGGGSYTGGGLYTGGDTDHGSYGGYSGDDRKGYSDEGYTKDIVEVTVEFIGEVIELYVKSYMVKDVVVNKNWMNRYIKW